jgi:hypothetical protein
MHLTAKLSATIAGLILAAVYSATPATAVTYIASLSADGESTSTGTGNATVVINGNEMTVAVSFSGLTTGTTASHIHCCTSSPGTGTAGVATTTPTFPSLPLGVTSGNFIESFDMTLASSFNPAFVTANSGSVSLAFAALLAGLNADEAYLNIHTTQFPSGEILGFLQATPIPGALSLFATGLCVIGLLAWLRSHAALFVPGSGTTIQTDFFHQILPPTALILGLVLTIVWISFLAYQIGRIFEATL